MRRTNIYLTPLQEEGTSRLSAATGQSMAALVRTAVNYMLAYPDRFPDLHGIAPHAKAAKREQAVPKAAPKVKRAALRAQP